MGDIINKKTYAVVTGAAAGMGKEYVKLLTKKGYCIVAADIDSAGLDALEEITGKDRVIKVCTDLSSPKGADDIINAVTANSADVEVLINNAGIFAYQNILDHPDGYIEKITGLHNITMAVLSRHFAAGMRRRGKGYILNISSLSAWMNYPGIAMYSATKSYTKAFSKALDCELQGTGVSVTVALFGGVATPLVGLSGKYLKLAVNLHVMITPENAARKALEAMFRRKTSIIPGLVNKIGKPFLASCPKWLLGIIDKKMSRFKRK